jgi:hypothetical protein
VFKVSSPIRVRIKSTCRDIKRKDEGSRLIDLIKTASLEKENHRFQSCLIVKVTYVIGPRSRLMHMSTEQLGAIAKRRLD